MAPKAGSFQCSPVQSFASFAADEGAPSISFWLGAHDAAIIRALGSVFGEVVETPRRPDGQPVETGDPAAYLPETWPEGVGFMAKHLTSGPGPLAAVDSTDALTAVMARLGWTYLDGDSM